MADPVKGRTEAGRRREERARQTRARITAAGLDLFLERGYLATSVEAIARAAGVAPATVYQAFGTKHAVLARALDTAIVGDEESQPLLERQPVMAVRRLRSPATRLAAVVSYAAQAAIRTAPLKRVMRDAAAADPAVRDLIDEDHRRRQITQRGLVELALGTAQLRRGVTLDSAATTFSLLVTSDGFDLARSSLGWTEDRWTQWLVGLLTHELLGVTGRR